MLANIKVSKNFRLLPLLQRNNFCNLAYDCGCDWRPVKRKSINIFILSNRRLIKTQTNITSSSLPVNNLNPGCLLGQVICHTGRPLRSS